MVSQRTKTALAKSVFRSVIVLGLALVAGLILRHLGQTVIACDSEDKPTGEKGIKDVNDKRLTAQQQETLKTLKEKHKDVIAGCNKVLKDNGLTLYLAKYVLTPDEKMGKKLLDAGPCCCAACDVNVADCDDCDWFCHHIPDKDKGDEKTKDKPTGEKGIKDVNDKRLTAQQQETLKTLKEKHKDVIAGCNKVLKDNGLTLYLAKYVLTPDEKMGKKLLDAGPCCCAACDVNVADCDDCDWFCHHIPDKDKGDEKTKDK